MSLTITLDTTAEDYRSDAMIKIVSKDGTILIKSKQYFSPKLLFHKLEEVAIHFPRGSTKKIWGQNGAPVLLIKEVSVYGLHTGNFICIAKPYTKLNGGV